MKEGRGPGYAATSTGASDPDLAGRTYAVPFEDVWQAARRLADGGIRGWHLNTADDQAGIITADADSLVGAGHEIVIRIGLDRDAQTRVDAAVTARRRGSDLGRALRRLRGFFRALDRSLARTGAPRPVQRP